MRLRKEMGAVFGFPSFGDSALVVMGEVINGDGVMV